MQFDSIANTRITAFHFDRPAPTIFAIFNVFEVKSKQATIEKKYDYTYKYSLTEINANRTKEEKEDQAFEKERKQKSIKE